MLLRWCATVVYYRNPTFMYPYRQSPSGKLRVYELSAYKDDSRRLCPENNSIPLKVLQPPTFQEEQLLIPFLARISPAYTILNTRNHSATQLPVSHS